MADVVLLSYRDMMPEGCVFITRADVPVIPAAAERSRADADGTVMYDAGAYRWLVANDRLVAFIDYGVPRVAGKIRRWKRVWCEEGGPATTDAALGRDRPALTGVGL